MPKLKPIHRFDLIGQIKEFFDIHPWSPIIPWIEKNVVLTDDVSSESDKPDFDRYPYQIDILKQWEDLNSRKHVTVVMCEQMGKTSTFVYGILYRLIYHPGSILVCYPSDSKRSGDQHHKVYSSNEEAARSKRRDLQAKDYPLRQDKA